MKLLIKIIHVFSILLAIIGLILLFSGEFVGAIVVFIIAGFLYFVAKINKFNMKEKLNNVSIDNNLQENLNLLEPLTEKDLYTGDDIWTIGANVQDIRDNKGITQKELGSRLGYKSASFVSKLELWDTDKLEHEKLVKLAEALEVEVKTLLRPRKKYF